MQTTSETAVVAEMDDTRVEIHVGRDGVDVRLDTPDLQPFDGLEEELRSSLQQGEADLLNYEAHDGSEAEKGERSRDAEQRERRRAQAELESDEDDKRPRRGLRPNRGSLVDILA